MSVNFLRDVVTNQTNKISIVGPGAQVSGYLTSQVTINGSVSWSPVMEVSGAQKKLKKASQILSKDSSAFSVDFPIQSRKIWDETNLRSFTFSFVVIAFHNNDDVLGKVKGLMHGVFPVSSGSGASRKFTPPGNYNANLSGGKPINTWSVYVGKNLLSISNLVITDLGYEISFEKLPNGRPLYVNVSVTFDAAENVSIDEAISWF